MFAIAKMESLLGEDCDLHLCILADGMLSDTFRWRLISPCTSCPVSRASRDNKTAPSSLPETSSGVDIDHRSSSSEFSLLATLLTPTPYNHRLASFVGRSITLTAKFDRDIENVGDEPDGITRLSVNKSSDDTILQHCTRHEANKIIRLVSLADMFTYLKSSFILLNSACLSEWEQQRPQQSTQFGLRSHCSSPK